MPLNELKPVPIPKFQTELITLKQAQFNLDAIVQQINNFDQKLYHKDPWHVQVFESEKVQQLADLKRKELEASINVEQAIARLDEAKLNNLLRLTLDPHVRVHPDKFQFCLSPTCPGIYAIAKEAITSTCCTCSLEVCLDCKASHANMSCDEVERVTFPFAAGSTPPELVIPGRAMRYLKLVAVEHDTER